MTKKYLDLKMDFMFKQLFGHSSRKSITIAFLNDLLHRQGDDRIVDVHYENTELIKDELKGKTSRLDVLVYTSSGERINVEIQLINQHDMPNRTLYYWAKLYSSSIRAGQNYSQLTPTIMISILNYPLFPHETDSFHNIFHLTEDNENFLWSPQIEFHSIDLSQFMVNWKKYRKEMRANPPAEYPWLIMLNAVDNNNKKIEEEMIHELEEWAMNEQEVREALIEWETLSANKENKVLYEARLKFLRDQLTNFVGERKAGREEGKLEEKRKVALEMLKKGLSIDLIEEITELSSNEVEELKKSL
jgi:predicted transposase/invertase (TIGR01784 family)